ncbi:rho GTPase-activating protein 21-like isoform X3 [Girardinichthys multiradiatus]|uniref:rho GTPase-activating protein 21-like isoform X3 n=2 Tax=Girardinichthys multiradiatus TaxID=208333 RepID=UPI001FAD68F6|nr:rho GTPase-activating protein 21-like isoform X3 [Girardinichthys multiradiatus]
MAQAKRRNDGIVSSDKSNLLPSAEVEAKSSQGPRTIVLQKNSQGFGFTLRHFIVYPPESTLHSLKDEENGNLPGKGKDYELDPGLETQHCMDRRSVECQRPCLEPMDTIFVKSVKENGPAQQAGLCTGDRLVKVNGESILGKTYSQVITLIQNSENLLELTIMPKDEDVLQLVSVYSQNFNSKGSKQYSGEAPNLPEPPRLFHSASTACSTLQQPTSSPPGPLDNWPRRGSSTISPLNNQTPATSTSSRPQASDASSSHFAPPWRHQDQDCASAALNAFDFHFANHNAAITSATLPPPRRSNLLVSSRANSNALCHQALSDWYYSQAEAADHIYPHHRSISQDYLVEPELGSAPSPRFTSGPTTSAEHNRRETFLHHHRAAAAVHESYWLGGWGCGSETASKSCSESLLAAYAEYEHNYGRSVETLAEASALVSQHYDQTLPKANEREQKKQKAPGLHEHKNAVTTTVTVSPTASLSPLRSGQVAEPQTRRLKDEELVGYKSYSPSFYHKEGHLLQQAHSFREPSYSAPYLTWGPGTRRDIDGGTLSHLQSTPIPLALEEKTDQLREDRELISSVSPPQEVVLRQRPHFTRQMPVEADSTPTESPEPSGWTPATRTIPIPKEMGPSRSVNGSLAHAFNSLSSIPFIDDPVSPSVDHQTYCVPAHSVVSGNQVSTAASITFTSVPPPPSASPPVRLRSQDLRSIKGRRSSYLLAITTERSKSCDEGLNTYRDERRVFSKLPKRVKSFFTDGSLDSLRPQEDVRSKRHSTSELGTITFSDVRKEGWLHYKQILTEKGKKVGGSMRPWKRAFSVLRHHSLFLYKDKREAVLHGAGAGSSQDEHPPVNIRGCLIDIAYSETKRKHTLRLTTQDFCEFLLQAEDRDDMLAWIRVIRENSKTDNEEIGFSRQALINKKLNDYRKHRSACLTGNKSDSSPRAHRMVPDFFLAKTDNTSVNRTSKADDNKALWGINLMKKTKKTGCPKAFGVRLEDCQPAANYKFVPLIVEMCCGVVEATGLEYTGIYRVPGNNAMVSSLQEHLNKGMDINTAEERWQDLNVISSLLKAFFRKLPEPLFTDDKYSDFIDANRIENAEDRLKTMKKLIHDLPDYYYHTLKFLVGHLKRIADHSEKNKMEPRNLALVFGPTLVRTSEDNMTDMVTHMPDRYKIVETLILYHNWFFSDGELDQEEKAPEDKGDLQPVPNIDHLLSNIGRPGMPGEASDSTTSDSVKLKIYSSSKKDLNAKDFLPKSIISAVTRKRKKCLSIHLPVSSGDEDSEHEAVKNTDYTEVVGGGTQEAAQGEHTCSKKEKRQGEEHVVASAEGTGGKEEIEKAVRKGVDREIRQRSSLLCSPQQSHATYPKPPAAIGQPSHVKIQSEAKERPNIPFWISPSRPPIPQASSYHSSQQADRSRAIPVCCRKTGGGWTRATSINLELELDRCKEKVRDQRPELVRTGEVLVAQCGNIQQGSVVDTGSTHQIDPLPTFPSPSRWIDQSSSSVVLRRSAKGSQAKTRAWRRHTVVI